MKNLKEYYSNRAFEYEKVYQKPERQKDLAEIRKILREVFTNQSVLELGCGTGYWTREISHSATSITGIDISESVLNIAGEKKYQCPTKLIRGSYYDFNLQGHTAIFGGFIISHILKENLRNFVERILESPEYVKVLFVDNLFVEGNNTPITRKDVNGNTYQLRKLKSGRTYEVLKNFPSKEEWNQVMADTNLVFTYKELEYFWILEIRKK